MASRARCGFDMVEWLKRSTAASKVPLRVRDGRVLAELAARLKLMK